MVSLASAAIHADTDLDQFAQVWAAFALGVRPADVEVEMTVSLGQQHGRGGPGIGGDETESGA